MTRIARLVLGIGVPPFAVFTMLQAVDMALGAVDGPIKKGHVPFAHDLEPLSFMTASSLVALTSERHGYCKP